MKNSFVLFILINSCFPSAFAQQKQIICSSERNADNSISIFAESQELGEYTIKLTFSSLMGYRSSPSVSSDISTSTIEKGKKEIMKLTLDKMSSSSQFQYSYTYYIGRALRKAPDSSFAYLLPATTGNSLRIFPVSSVAERLNLKNKEDYFYSTGFIYKLGDTICASRAGLVYNCNDDVKQGETTTDFYKSSRNNIEIQHKDGSLDRYNFVAPIQLLVKAGDYVYPGQRIAVFNKESARYYLLFSTYYLDQNKVNNIKAYGSEAPSSYVFLPTHFYAAESEKPARLEINKEYTVQHPKELIVAEMSKRDKKKLGYD